MASERGIRLEVAESLKRWQGSHPAICIEVAWVLTPLPSEDEPWPRLYGTHRPRPERANQLIKLPPSVRHNLRLAAVACQVEISELGEIAIRQYLARLSEARVRRGLPPLPEAVPGELEAARRIDGAGRLHSRSGMEG